MSDNAATDVTVSSSSTIQSQISPNDKEESPDITKSLTNVNSSETSLEGGQGSGSTSSHPAREAAGSSSSAGTSTIPDTPTTSLPPSIHKRKLKQKPKGILKPAPPPTKAFSFRRDILQQLNTRLAQQGVNVQVPVPQGPSTLGSLSETAQGTAQVAGSILGGMFKRMSGFAAAQSEEGHHQSNSGHRSISSSGAMNSHGRQDIGQNSSQRSATPLTSGREGTAPMNNLPAPSSSIRPLRKVRFTVSSMTVTYPISNAIAPGDEDATRLRVEKDHREKLKSKSPSDWTVADLERLYRECCRTREEHPLKKMRSVFLENGQQTPPGLRTIDLSFTTLDRQAIEPVADLLSVDFGLNKLVLENCGLTDDGLKSILHSLLVSGSLPSLSLASNKKIKYHGWRYVGIFMRRARALKYLDLSENSINKASLEHIAGAIAKAGSTSKRIKEVQQIQDEDMEEPLTIKAKLLNDDTEEASSLTSLRLENCGLRTNSLEMLAQSVRFSDLNHLSLRRNRIGQIGAVALAVMLKDYPDSTQTSSQRGTAMGELERLQQQQLLTKQNLQSQQYAVRSTSAARRSHSPSLPQVPSVVSSPGGGVTRRSMPVIPVNGLLEDFESSASNTPEIILSELDSPVLELERTLTETEREQVRQLKQDERRTEEEAITLFHARRAKRILSILPRVGHLLTLDLKGNDIRGGVVYLSQALKKNRTLKVLNLSDNNIEMSGLVAIADALKYNATLETLDLSHNPCCGPSLEGITTLRNAFTLNSNLKRLFISDTDLSSEGAIALAEFLPEAKSLIHLDLTENLQIDIAGVMALAVSVRLNKSLRCLDLNIPPNAPDFARLSQEILNSCIRNTESAQRKAQQRGVKAPIAAPIYKSTLARAAKEKEERTRLVEANSRLESTAAAEAEKNKEKVVEAAHECCLVLQELLNREEEKKKEMIKERSTRKENFVQSELASDLLTQGRFLREKLQRALSVIKEGEQLSRALQINDELESVISKLEGLYSGPIIGIQSDEANNMETNEPIEPLDKDLLHAPGVIESGLSSPTFSIGSDDEEEEGEEEGEDGQSSLSSSKKGLGMQLIDSKHHDSVEEEEQHKAAREIPSEKDLDEGQDGNDKVNYKARGQLSEEGELFRRARSLNIDGNGEEDEELGSGMSSAVSISSSTSSTLNSESNNHPTKVREELEDSSSTQRQRERSGSLSKGETEVSGEELRRELLDSDVPRAMPTRIINEEGKTQVEAPVQAL